MLFFIVPPALNSATNWKASSVCDVAPIKIQKGAYAGSYAVNTEIFSSDGSFDKYKAVLEPLEKSTLNNGRDLIPDTPYD